jgi:pilus assembly protein CpaE
MTTIVESQSSKAVLFGGAIGPSAEVVPNIEALRHHLEERPDEYAVVIGPAVDLKAAVALAEGLRVTRPALSVILLRQRVDTSVLAEALRSGMREVVEERDLTGMALAVRRAQGLHHALIAGKVGHGSMEVGKLITVFAAKGGVGKTTVSTNMAVALSTLGQRVCIVDFDLAFGDVAITLKLPPERTISEALGLTGDFGPEEIQPLLTKYSDTLSALLAPKTPDASEDKIRAMSGRVLAALRQTFDYVIVDSPPAFDDQVLQAFDESDLILLVLTPDIPALKNLKITLEMLELLNHSRDRFRVVLNRADAKVGLSTSDVEKALKTGISALIPAAPEVAAAINRGEPVVTAHPRHPASQAFMGIATEWVRANATAVASQQDQGADSNGDKRRSFLRRKSA